MNEYYIAYRYKDEDGDIGYEGLCIKYLGSITDNSEEFIEMSEYIKKEHNHTNIVILNIIKFDNCK